VPVHSTSAVKDGIDDIRAAYDDSGTTVPDTTEGTRTRRRHRPSRTQRGTYLEDMQGTMAWEKDMGRGRRNRSQRGSMGHYADGMDAEQYNFMAYTALTSGR